MTDFLQANATPTIALLTLVSNLIFIIVLIVIFAHAETKAKLYNFVHKYILELLFWGIMSAVVGSLIYSDIVGFPPCDLCWWQRILLYPQALLLLVAMKKKDKGIIDYLVPLSVLGAIVSLYHSLVQWGFLVGTGPGCVSVGGECARVYVLSYSYITIPFMSFTVFAYIIALKYIYYRKNKNG
jgi:disulfide bond formation protein DsbB